MSELFEQWCYNHISIDDITLRTGSYVDKHEIYVGVVTCGYLEKRLLLHYNTDFECYTSINRNEYIQPESLYPPMIKTKDQLCNYVRSLIDGPSSSCEIGTGLVDEHNFIFILDYIIVYWFTKMIRQGEFNDWELSINTDFSHYDY